MTYLRHGLVAAATLLAAPYSIVLAAEPFEESDEAVTEVLLDAGQVPTSFQHPLLSAYRFLPSGLGDPELVGSGAIQGKAGEARYSLENGGIAVHAMRPLKGVEFGLGLANDVPVNGLKAWYGVYLQSLDRIAEQNTIYGLLRENPLPGLNNSKAPTAFCCQHSNTLTSLERFASTITTREVSPTFFLFGLLRKKGWNLNLDNGWKLQAGTLRYNDMTTRVGFLSVEHHWESLRTSYSYQLERSRGLSIAPSHVLQFDYLYGLHNSIGLTFANGRELADFGTLGILNTEVRSVGVRGQHWFKRDWALTFQTGHSDHGSLPKHKGARMGLRYSF